MIIANNPDLDFMAETLRKALGVLGALNGFNIAHNHLADYRTKSKGGAPKVLRDEFNRIYSNFTFDLQKPNYGSIQSIINDMVSLYTGVVRAQMRPEQPELALAREIFGILVMHEPFKATIAGLSQFTVDSVIDDVAAVIRERMVKNEMR